MYKKAFRMFPYFWLSDEAWARTREGLIRDRDVADEVVLFCDMMHSPYMSDENLKFYSEVAARRVKEMKELGFHIGYNMLQTVGHGEYAVNCLDKPVYNAKMDHDGRQGQQMPCMRDKKFLSFIEKKYRVFSEGHPEFLWVDDDFRTNDTDIATGCFCDNCMGIFNKLHGTSYSRESLVEILSKNDETGVAWRAKWGSFVLKSYLDIFRLINKTVKSVDSDIELRLMVVHLAATAYYQNDYTKFAEALGAKVIRPGGGSFNESDIYFSIKKACGVAEQNAVLAGYDESQYECEDWPQTYYKSGYYHVLEGTLAMMAGCTGVAFASIDPQEGQEYVIDALDKAKEMWNNLDKIGRNYKLYGSTAFYKKESALYAPGTEFFKPIIFTMQWETFKVFPAGFVSYTPYQDNSNITFFCGDTVLGMSKEEIEKVFSKGVFLDGRAVSNLLKMGYGDLIGCKSMSSSNCSQVERYTKHPINGTAAGTVRYFWPMETFLFETVEGAEALGIGESVNGVVSDTCTYVYENKLGGRVCVCGYFPYDYIGTWQKTLQWNNLFDWLAKDKLYAKVEGSQHVSFFYKKSEDQKDFMLMAINAFLDETSENTTVKLLGSFEGKKIYCYNQYSELSEISKEDISVCGDYTIIRLPKLTAWGFVVLYTE